MRNIVYGSDSLKNKIKLDTLKKERPHVVVQSKEISGDAQHITDSLQPDVAGLNRKVTHAQNKADSLRDKISSRIAKLKGNTGKKLSDVKDTGIDIPEIKELQLPSVEKKITSLPSVNSSDTSPHLETNIPGIDALKLPSTDTNIPNILSETADLDKVNTITDELEGIDDKIGEVENYEADLLNIRKNAPDNLDKLSEQAEQKLTEIPEVGTASEEITQATEEQAKYEAMIQRYRDRKLLEEEINRKYKAVANDYVMQQTGKVQEAQKQLQLSKYKATRVKSVKDIFKKQSDELEEKKFYQRLVPGITWQIYTKDFVLADVSLQVGYRVTPRLTTGIGAIYRLGFDKQFDFFVKGLKTFGGRAYLDITIAKGLYAHAEFEALKLHPTTSLNTNEAFSNKLYESYFGFGKRFNITRYVRGNVLGLYRVEHAGKLPAASKVSVRFGIDYVFRRPKKKLSGL